MSARLVLQDGTVFEGEAFGAPATVVGEVVFNTSLTGYQESHHRPLLSRADGLHDAGACRQHGRQRRGCRATSRRSPPWSCARSASRLQLARQRNLAGYLARHGIPGISEHRHARADAPRLRDKGVLHAALCTDGSTQHGGTAGAGPRLGRAGRARPGAGSHLQPSRTLDRRHARRMDAGARGARLRRASPRRRSLMRRWSSPTISASSRTSCAG
jgi:hypothetical protein